MARPRKPTALLLLTGAFRRNRARGADRELEPSPKAGIGEAPAWLSAPEQAAWRDLARAAPRGVLGDSDRAHLELTARLLAYARSVPIEAADTAKLTRLEAMLGKLGFNPTHPLRQARK